MEKIQLWSDPAKKDLTLTPYLLPGEDKRPAILVIPGGGYGGVCEATEGQPIARAFNALGYHTFVLQYRCAPHRYPAPQQDAIRALRIIRYNAEKWNVIADRVAVCGFSAGGHLAGSMGTITEGIPDVENDDVDKERGNADAMILSYGVLCFEDWSHMGTQTNLLGDAFNTGLREHCSLEKQVGSHTPPAFLWHTVEDGAVPYLNSVNFVKAMTEHKRPVEFHLFPYGDHGTLLGMGTKDISRWPELAVSFLNQQWEMRDGGEEAVRGRYAKIYETQENWLKQFK